MMALLKKRYGERIPSRRLRRFTHGALAPVTTLLVNRELAFVGMPGEPFVEFQLYLRAHSPLPNSYFLGYCNDNLFRARIGAGMGRTYICHNRRKVLPDGSVKMFWRNAEKEPTHPVDPTVSVLRIDDISGSPKAVLVNYSCHPTVLGPDNLQISADYVGVMRGYVEKEIPGAICLFIFGASGDINPYFDKQPVTEKPFEAVGWTGETLGKAVVRTAQRIETEPANEKGIQYASKVHEFQHRFNAGQRVKIATGVGLLNGKIGFVGFSADPFVEHQIRLRDQSDTAMTFVFAHTSTRAYPMLGTCPRFVRRWKEATERATPPWRKSAQGRCWWTGPLFSC